MKSSVIVLIVVLMTAACQTDASIPSAAPDTQAAPPTRSGPDAATATIEALTVYTATLPPPPTATATAVPPVMRVSPSDGMPQVFVPEGTLRMGGLEVHAEDDELPNHTVRMHAFWIDQLEVTNGMYGLCVQAGICRPPGKTSSQNRAAYFENPEFQDYPVIQITWLDAKTYCEWAGRRLPAEAEWERAARGDDMRTYPWGDEPPSGLFSNFENLVRDTSRAGSYAPGASPFGALDMAGNVWEWTADIYDAHYYLSSPESDPPGPSDQAGRFQRVIRGGSFVDGPVDVRLSNRGYAAGPDPYAAYDSPNRLGTSSARIGFRCASDP